MYPETPWLSVDGSQPSEIDVCVVAVAGDVPRHGRGAPVRDAHRLVHVGLDLARAQGLVVDADVVDQPVEEASREPP